MTWRRSRHVPEPVPGTRGPLRAAPSGGPSHRLTGPDAGGAATEWPRESIAWPGATREPAQIFKPSSGGVPSVASIYRQLCAVGPGRSGDLSNTRSPAVGHLWNWQSLAYRASQEDRRRAAPLQPARAEGQADHVSIQGSRHLSGTDVGSGRQRGPQQVNPGLCDLVAPRVCIGRILGARRPRQGIGPILRSHSSSGQHSSEASPNASTHRWLPLHV